MAITKPSVSELLQHAECRYTLVVKVAKRARELVAGAQPLLETQEIKPVSIAVDEIQNGLILHESPREADE